MIAVEEFFRIALAAPLRIAHVLVERCGRAFSGGIASFDRLMRLAGNVFCPKLPFPWTVNIRLLLKSPWAREIRRVTAFAALVLAPFASAAEPNLSTFTKDIQPILEQYCYDCHGDGSSKGGVTLDEFKNAAALRDPKLWSRALKNVRGGIMPPADGDPLPAPEAEKLMAWMKSEGMGLDPAKPDPGRVTVRRLNRVEYRNTIRDLLGIDYDTHKEFPADDTGHGFDNISDVLTISPLLMEKYIDAAQTVVDAAVVTKPRVVVEERILGKEFATVKVDTTIPEPPKPEAPPAEAAPAEAAPAPVAAVAIPPPPAPAAAALPPNAAQVAQAAPAAAAQGRRAGAPGRGQQFGRGRGRGGPPPVTRPAPVVENDAVVMSYYTPATTAAKHRVEHAGKYQILLDVTAQETYADNLFDLNKCQVIFSLDGEKLLDREFVREGYGRKFEFTYDHELTAGEHVLSMEIQPISPETPQYRKLRMRINAVTFRGPMAPEFWAKTPGYDKYFPRDVPADAKGRHQYAREILGNFASKAFRRPVDPRTLDQLVATAEKVAAQPTHTFETGIAQAMVAVLSSPAFIFREDHTEPLKRGQGSPLIDEYSLASRLSYFIWSSMPDDELIKLAAAGRLRANLPAQIKRMLGDPKADELVRNFAGQWLQARDIVVVPINAVAVYLRDHPNPEYEEALETVDRISAVAQADRTPEDTTALAKANGIIRSFNSPGQVRSRPDLTDPLRRAMEAETELTFGYVLKEDRSILELIESDYTFLNEDLAKFYGISGVSGAEMRKVTLPPDSPRGGVLTQGTVLAVTSNPTRTSPVKRGLFILDAILGAPPPPPPPNIPPLEQAGTPQELKKLSLRDTLALHATKSLCASCHMRMDPLGLALENFNAMGQWRTTDDGQPVQTAGKLTSGETFADARGLKHLLVTSHRREFYYSFAEKLLTYALGRGLEYYDTTTLDQLASGLESTGGRLTDLIEAIINSAPFQQRRDPNPAVASVSEAALAGHLAQATP